jgi:hypothetical protein
MDGVMEGWVEWWSGGVMEGWNGGGMEGWASGMIHFSTMIAAPLRLERLNAERRAPSAERRTPNAERFRQRLLLSDADSIFAGDGSH